MTHLKKDKILVFFLEILLLVVLFFALFVSSKLNRLALAIFLTIYTIITYLFLKNKQKFSLYTKQVTLVMLVFGVIYLIFYYLMGLYFGYYKNPRPLSINVIKNYIIPITIIVISSEILRNIFLNRSKKGKSFLAYLAMVFIDIAIYSNIYNIDKLDDFLTLLGFVVFASISCNLLYNYISLRYGTKPVIIYRLITLLYMYFVPILPDIYVFFSSFLRMLYPYLIYLFLDYSFEKKRYVAAKEKVNYVSISIMVIFMVMVVMLVSCRFKYGILVIGSGSMTGTINKGDATVYRTYNNGEKIKKNDIIIFNVNGVRYVHRVISIKNINNKIRYYTKGDANQQADDWVLTNKDIIGKSLFKIKYLGYPTLWLRDLFS